MAQSRKKSKNKIQINPWLAIILGFISFFAMTGFGFFGIFSANIFRFFVGDAYRVFALILFLFSIYLLIRGEIHKIKMSKQIIGITLIVLSILTFLHAIFFEPIINTETDVLSATWTYFLSDFMSNSINQTLGGGMIGGFLYGLSYFLFSQVGTYILLVFTVILGILFITDTSFSEVNAFLIKSTNIVGGWISQAFTQVKGSNKQAKSENKTKKKPKKKKETPEPKDSIQSDSVDKTVEEAAPQKSIPIDMYKPIQEDDIDPQSVIKQPPVQESKTKENSIDIDNDESQTLEIVSEEENEGYRLPPLHLLEKREVPDQSKEYDTAEDNVNVLQKTLESFDVDAEVVKVNIGPSVTMYEIEPGPGVKVNKIENLSKDIALAMAAKDVRIEAPIPGKRRVGIEVPNKKVAFVSFREVMVELGRDNENLLEVPLGKDVSGHVITAELDDMPHLLVAGATGSGKSVAINGMITAILMRAKPHEVKLMMIDPKMVELSVYNDIPHLLTPVVTNPKKAANALNKVVQEMDRRYELLSSTGTRNRKGYNEFIKKHNEETGDNKKLLPYIVVIVDELADLMMVAGKDVEAAISRIAQKARAAGIHMILATQRPSVDVITGSIKANIPSRMAFSVSSGTDSRTILDQNGAEKLLGRGDMLFKPVDRNAPIRIQGSFIEDQEVEEVVSWVKQEQEPNYVEEMEPTEETSAVEDEPEDELFDEAVELIMDMETASISMLQRRLRIGYNRAARIMGEMEDRGFVSPQDGSKPRDVYIQPPSEDSEEDPENNQELPADTLN